MLITSADTRRYFMLHLSPGYVVDVANRKMTRQESTAMNHSRNALKGFSRLLCLDLEVMRWTVSENYLGGIESCQRAHKEVRTCLHNSHFEHTSRTCAVQFCILNMRSFLCNCSGCDSSRSVHLCSLTNKTSVEVCSKPPGSWQLAGLWSLANPEHRHLCSLLSRQETQHMT